MPRYDVVAVAPLIVIVLGSAGPALASQAGLSLELATAILVGAMVMTACAMPPSLDEWRLTGHHRISAMNFSANEYQQTA